MKCPNTECGNTALGDDYAFCFKCGSKILNAKEEPSSPSSPSVDDNNKTPATNVEDPDVQEDTDALVGKIGEYKVDSSWISCY